MSVNEESPAPESTSAGSFRCGSLSSYPTLRRGSRGVAVGNAQCHLNRHGYQLVMDSVFGAKTEGAVRRFQAARNLGVDGVVGPITWASLRS